MKRIIAQVVRFVNPESHLFVKSVMLVLKEEK